MMNEEEHRRQRRAEQQSARRWAAKVCGHCDQAAGDDENLLVLIPWKGLQIVICEKCLERLNATAVEWNQLEEYGVSCSLVNRGAADDPMDLGPCWDCDEAGPVGVIEKLLHLLGFRAS